MIDIRLATSSDISNIFEVLHRKFLEKEDGYSYEESLKEHSHWYNFIISSPNYLFFLIVDEGDNYLGQIKIELEENLSILSIFIHPSFRHKGVGRAAILKILDYLKGDSSIDSVLVYILPENKVSKEFFKGLSFNFIGYEDYHGIDHLTYEFKLD